MAVIEKRRRISVLQSQIRASKQSLAAIQEKVLLNIEFSSAGEVVLYDAQELHSQAQELRALIEEYKNEIEALQTEVGM